MNELPPIPLFKPFMAEDAPAKVAEVLTSGYIGQGPQVEAFEAELHAFLETPVRPVTVNSCTSAITLALRLIGVGRGDTVISTPQTCAATNLPILHTGAKIEWADIDPFTGLIDPRTITPGMAARARAIVAVDWGGQLCDYAALRTFRKPIIQDAAHHFTYDRNRHGDYICYSFQAIKHLTTGDGGALIPPPEFAERARLLRWYGLDRTKGDSFRCSQDIIEGGYKFHMNDIAAAIGRANLREQTAVQAAWARNAKRIGCAIQNPWLEVAAMATCPWFLPVFTIDGAGFEAHMKAQGIACSPVHRRNDTFSCLADFETCLPGVTEFSEKARAIPCGWWLTERDCARIVEAVNAWQPT